MKNTKQKRHPLKEPEMKAIQKSLLCTFLIRKEPLTTLLRKFTSHLYAQNVLLELLLQVCKFWTLAKCYSGR